MVRNPAKLTISPGRPGRKTNNLPSPYLNTTPAEYPLPSAGFNTTPDGPVFPAYVLDAPSRWPADLNSQDDQESQQANQIYDFSPAPPFQDVNSSDSFTAGDEDLFGDNDSEFDPFKGIQYSIPELPEETGLVGDAAVPAQAVARPATTADHAGHDGSSKATAHSEQLPTPDLSPQQQSGASQRVVEPAVVVIDDDVDLTPPRADASKCRMRERAPSDYKYEPPKKRQGGPRQSRYARLTQNNETDPNETWDGVKQRTGMSLAVPGAKRIDLPPTNVPWPGRQPQFYDMPAQPDLPVWMRFQQEQAWRDQGNHAYQNQYGSHGNFEQYPSGFGQRMPDPYQQAGLRNQNQPFQYQHQSHEPYNGNYGQTGGHQQQHRGEVFQQNYSPYVNNRSQQQNNGWNTPQNDPFARQMQQMQQVHSNLPNQQANYAQSQRMRPAQQFQQPLHQQNRLPSGQSSQSSGNTYIPQQPQQQYPPQTPARQLMPTMAPTPSAPRLPATYDTGIRREAGRGGRGGRRDGGSQTRQGPVSISSQGSPMPNDQVRDGATKFGFQDPVFFGASTVPQAPTTQPANPHQCYISQDGMFRSPEGDWLPRQPTRSAQQAQSAAAQRREPSTWQPPFDLDLNNLMRVTPPEDVPRDFMSNFDIIPDPLATETIFQQASAQSEWANTSALDKVNFTGPVMSDQQLAEALRNATRDVAAPAMPCMQAGGEVNQTVAGYGDEADLEGLGDIPVEFTDEDFQRAMNDENWLKFDSGGSQFQG
jgi:hypothetical protein